MTIIKTITTLSVLLIISCSSGTKVKKTDDGYKPNLRIFIIKDMKSSMDEQYQNRLNQISEYIQIIMSRDAKEYGFSLIEAASINECKTEKTYCLSVKINEYIPFDRSNRAGNYFAERLTFPTEKGKMRYDETMSDNDNLQKHEQATLSLSFELGNNYAENSKPFKYPFVLQDLNWKQCVIRSSRSFFDEYFIANAN